MDHHDPLTGEVRKARRVTFKTTGPSRAKQAHKDECDINRIMKRYAQTGLIEHVNRYEGSYADFTIAPADYHQAVNQVLAAQGMFMSLPSKIRAQFQNDPGAFLAFVEDPANGPALVEMGLARAPEPAPAADPPADETPPRGGS